MRVLIWIVPFAKLQRMTYRVSAPAKTKRDPRPILASIRQSARLVPVCTCLTQAYAARFLLARAGHASTIHIGVASGDGRLSAHAWVTMDNQTILGEFAPGEFQELLALKAA